MQFKIYYQTKLTNKKTKKKNKSALLKSYQDHVVPWDLTFLTFCILSFSLFIFLACPHITPFAPPKPEMGVERLFMQKVSLTVYLTTLQQSSDKSLQVQYSPVFDPFSFSQLLFFWVSTYLALNILNLSIFWQFNSNYYLSSLCSSFALTILAQKWCTTGKRGHGN